MLGVENDFGSISAGKIADFIVLDQNLFELEPTDIYRTQVSLTILNGKSSTTRRDMENRNYLHVMFSAWYTTNK